MLPDPAGVVPVTTKRYLPAAVTIVEVDFDPPQAGISNAPKSNATAAHASTHRVRARRTAISPPTPSSSRLHSQSGRIRSPRGRIGLDLPMGDTAPDAVVDTVRADVAGLVPLTVMLAGEKLQPTPALRPPHSKATVPAKPPVGVTETV